MDATTAENAHPTLHKSPSPPVLPEDCILLIMGCLEAQDLARAATVCSAWDTLSRSNSLWRALCVSRWSTWSPPEFVVASTSSPTFYPSFSSEQSSPRFGLSNLTLPPCFTVASPPLNSWKEVYALRHERDGIVRLLIANIIEDSRDRIRHLEGIVAIGMEARDVLRHILNGTGGQETDLSRAYYARKALRRLRRAWVLDQWRQYRLDKIDMPLWQGYGLICMFANYELELSDLDRQFQDLADEFLHSESLRGNSEVASTSSSLWSPRSPTFPSAISSVSKTSVETQSQPRKEQDERRLRHLETCTAKVERLAHFFSVVKGFRGNVERYFDPSNSFLDKVFERRLGIPISLSVIFAELANRCGIEGIQLMGFPQHFMIRYQPPPFLVGNFDGEDNEMLPPPTPPYYFLDLFHRPRRLISMDEYQEYFSQLGLPKPGSIYNNLPTPPIEIYLRSLRNIILAIERSGGAGGLNTDHEVSLYSAMTQLLVLHPGEEWNFYVLWLQYLESFWPEDLGLIRTAIEEMEGIDIRRAARNYHLQQQQSRNSNGGQAGLTFMATANGVQSAQSAAMGSLGSHNQRLQTVKILRGEVRQMEEADEAGDVGMLRRRRRPRPSPPATSLTRIGTGSPRVLSSSPNAESANGSSIHLNNNSVDLTPNLMIERQRMRTMSNNTTTPGSPMISSALPPASPSTATAAAPSPSPDLASASAPVSASTSAPPPLQLPFSNSSRNNTYVEPEYYVGEIFQHRYYLFIAAIYGYDFKCEAEESWIISMGIDALQFGRNQPFYNAILQDGTRRYVAQENIQILFREFSSPPKLPPAPMDSVRGAESGGQGDEGIVGAEEEDQDATLSAALTTGLQLMMEGNGEQSVVVELGLSSASSLSAGEATLEPPIPTLEQLDEQRHRDLAARYPGSDTEAGPVALEEVGRYFKGWDKERKHYIMNQELQKRYPTEDYLF